MHLTTFNILSYTYVLYYSCLNGLFQTLISFLNIVSRYPAAFLSIQTVLHVIAHRKTIFLLFVLNVMYFLCRITSFFCFCHSKSAYSVTKPRLGGKFLLTSKRGLVVKSGNNKNMTSSRISVIDLIIFISNCFTNTYMILLSP